MKEFNSKYKKRIKVLLDSGAIEESK